MAALAQDPLAQNLALADVVHPDFHQVNSTIEAYIKNQLGLKLDTDEQICRLALTPAGCPLGPLHCPLRHTTPSPLNFGPPEASSVGRDRLATVCKHWLRGLCKKGDACEFLHEYNLRHGPECKRGHPKPDIPPPEAYRPPSPPSQRDLGPPPPGYGRFEHGGGQGGPAGGFVVGANNPGFVPRRNLDDVLCFKVG
ncbi:RNA-binding component of cleavage and polyadenylation factor [Ceratobasidium sp. 370]|nr:RNA-binding component of cleavage and polyadenylation factor [Ceratobasidium sp. 370]